MYYALNKDQLFDFLLLQEKGGHE